MECDGAVSGGKTLNVSEKLAAFIVFCSDDGVGCFVTIANFSVARRLGEEDNTHYWPT